MNDLLLMLTSDASQSGSSEAKSAPDLPTVNSNDIPDDVEGVEEIVESDDGGLEYSFLLFFTLSPVPKICLHFLRDWYLLSHFVQLFRFLALWTAR